MQPELIACIAEHPPDVDGHVAERVTRRPPSPLPVFRDRLTVVHGELPAVVRLVGFEPTRPLGHGLLRTASLPFLHSRRHREFSA
jgi:hypothetical protein